MKADPFGADRAEVEKGGGCAGSPVNQKGDRPPGVIAEPAAGGVPGSGRGRPTVAITAARSGFRGGLHGHGTCVLKVCHVKDFRFRSVLVVPDDGPFRYRGRGDGT